MLDDQVTIREADIRRRTGFDPRDQRERQCLQVPGPGAERTKRVVSSVGA